MVREFGTFEVERHPELPDVEGSLIRSSIIRAWQWDIGIVEDNYSLVWILDPGGRPLGPSRHREIEEKI